MISTTLLARTTRAAAPRLVGTATLARRFAAKAHGHGHGAPAPAANAAPKGEGFFANLPRNPNYEGLEGVVRYYLPTNDLFVLFVMSNYAAIVGFFVWRNNSKKAAAAAKAPPPAFPSLKEAVAQAKLKAAALAEAPVAVAAAHHH